MVPFIAFCKYLILTPQETVPFKQYMLTFPEVHQFFYHLHFMFYIYILVFFFFSFLYRFPHCYMKGISPYF